jgi:hypothetical protein
MVSNYPDFATILNKTGQIEGINFVKVGYFVSQRAIIEIEKKLGYCRTALLLGGGVKGFLIKIKDFGHSTNYLPIHLFLRTQE